MEVALETLEAARKAVEAAGDKQAVDILLLDTRAVSSFADYFVICSGESDKQLQAIFDEIEEQLKKEGVTPLHREGVSASGWMLLDYGDFVVHVFAPREREYYQLEKLWSGATTILREL